MRAEHHPQPDALALARLIVRRPGWMIRPEHNAMIRRMLLRLIRQSIYDVLHPTEATP